MKALLLVAHGSRRAQSNDEVRALARRLGQGTGPFSVIAPAFLELADPSIPEGIAQCIEQGAASVTVFPYFLSAGRHVVTDIPAAVEVARQRFPGTEIHIAEHLGAADAIAGLILACSSTTASEPRTG